MLDTPRPETDASLILTVEEGEPTVIRLQGPCLTRTIGAIDRVMRDVSEEPGPVVIDMSEVTRFDTAGAWLIERVRRERTAAGRSIEIVGAAPAVVQLLGAVRSDAEDAETGKTERPSVLAIIGKAVSTKLSNAADDVAQGLMILGATVRGAQMKAGRRRRVSIAPVVTHIDKMGVQAVPIIVLMATIIGAIIAQQGAFQLRAFGGELFVVDLVGILVLREIGVLITAIMIAGRSGSAITAEIGSMKMREEVDALTVMGLNPVGVLVFPRLVALVIALPLLSMIANFAALAGAAVIANVYSGITLDAFVSRLREAIDLTSVFSGLIKAPFMAIIIGVIAAIEGLKVEGSAESLGNHVTQSVVKSIFVVIVVDGLFAIFFAAIDF